MDDHAAAIRGESAGGGPRAATGRILLVGARRQVRRLSECLQASPWASCPVVGFVDHSGRGRQLVLHPRSAPVPILGRLDRLSELIRESGATEVMVALPERPAVRLRPKLGRLDRPEVRVHWIAQDVPVGAEPWRGQPTWGIQRVPWSLRGGRLAKRGLDIVVSLVALIVLAPLLAAIALAIQLSTGQPVLYSQLRVGQGGRLFRIWKFRSMRVDAERETGPVWACNHDERCTRIGDFLRQTNLDELPQLFNVLIGDMSLVGPRPERPMFVEKFRGELPAYEDRHAVPVGLTGWAQIHGWRGRTSLRKRIQYDLDYIRHWSLAMDLRILLMTVPHVLYGRIRWDGGVRWLRKRRPQ